MHIIFVISLLLCARAQDDLSTTRTKSGIAIMENVSLRNGTSNKNETVMAKNHIPQETTTIVSLILNNERGKAEHIIGGSAYISNQTDTRSKDATLIIEKVFLSEVTSNKNETETGKNRNMQETTTNATSTSKDKDVRGKAEHIIGGSASISNQTDTRSKDATLIIEKVFLSEVTANKNETEAGKNRDLQETTTNATSTLTDEDVRDKFEHIFVVSSPALNETGIISNETEINIRSISNGKGSGGGNNLIADFSTKAPSTVPTPDSKETERCAEWSGLNGICVRYDLCEEKLEDSDTDLLIDIHAPPPCSSYLDTCCSLNHTTTSTHPPEENRNPKNGSSCGRRNPGGVGFSLAGDFDRHAKFGEFPWMVAVLSVRNESKADNESESDSQEYAVYLGGGSLINPSVVLTAAHLFTTSGGLRIRAGEWDTQTRREIYQHQERDVQEVLLHENYKKSNLYYDVALLFLSTPVEMAPHVGTACLPPAGALAAPGAHCFASGWGKSIFGKQGYYSVILKKVELPIVEKAVCRELLCKTRLGRHFNLHPSFMCAGGEIGMDTCTGDGGSPLVCPINSESERYEQSGVVSWGIGCGQDRTPGVYADVSVVRDWIDGEVRARGFDPATYTY